MLRLLRLLLLFLLLLLLFLLLLLLLLEPLPCCVARCFGGGAWRVWPVERRHHALVALLPRERVLARTPLACSCAHGAKDLLQKLL